MALLSKTFAGAILTLIASFSTSVYGQGFEVTNLVSDIPGNAQNSDPNLINPWGLTFDKYSNLIVADNGVGLATSYTPQGVVRVFMFSADTTPTGIERNRSETDFFFTYSAQSYRAEYIAVTEGGEIYAYNRDADPNNAISVVNNTGSAVYKGLALGEFDGEARLFATNFFTGQVDVYDGSFSYLFSFSDPQFPTNNFPSSGFAPFNCRILDGNLYVTYALRESAGTDDVEGLGNGYVDIFTQDGVLTSRLVSQGQLDSPWGLAKTPAEFCGFGCSLLVGNFGNGVINAYHPTTGTYLGPLTDERGTIISIDGLWSLMFSHRDHSKLYFTAGTNDEDDGTVGQIVPKCHHHHSSSSSSS